MKFQTITGFRDILPPESALWNRVERTAREVFGTYGYGEIRLPILEPTELFARSIGAETDVVSKEMYVFDLYGSHGLEYSRDILLGKSVTSPEGEPVTVSDADRQIGEFVRQTEIAMASDRFPKTGENTGALQQIKKLHAEFHETRERLEATPEYDPHLSWTDELYELSGAIQDYARAMSLGLYVALRPEATASVARAYIEHGMHLRPGNVKLCYIGPMFRRERPQKGRYRQFYQIGAELLGPSDHPALDAEVIQMLMVFFEKIHLKGTTLYLNSIGDKDCRPAYVEKLREELRKVKDQLGPDSQRRIEANPLRVLDSKLHEEQAVIEKLPHIAEHLCDACKAHYAELKRQLALRGIFPKENWRLVRGLDYYTRTTFEITATGLGSQNAVCGGGRYDGLVELLGGPATTKGIGFAIGTDRLILSLQETMDDSVPSEPGQVTVCVNGRAVGSVSEDMTLEAAVQHIAQEHGLRSFHIKLDGTRITTGYDANKALKGTKSLDLSAKDSRGSGIDVFLAWFGAPTYPAAVALARKLREQGLAVEMPAVEMKFGKSLSLADRLGARYAVILGEEELAAKQFTVKRLADGEQKKLSEADLLAYLQGAQT